MNESEPVRVRLDLSYDGGDFSGWAKQPGLRTVQGEIETALATVTRVSGPQLTVAGRTDAGVHARGQVAHVDLPRPVWDALPGRGGRTPAEAAVTRLRGVLPADITVREAALAPAGFDARFSAIWRRYTYRIHDTGAGGGDPLTRSFVLDHRRALDAAAMAGAGAQLLGEHDFLAYCKPRPGATTIRTLLDLDVTRTPGGVIEVGVRADAFCHSMVRSIVGALLAVGEGRRPTGWPREALEARTRAAGVAVAPAHGLVLEEVGYPAESELAARAVAARSVRTLER